MLKIANIDNGVGEEIGLKIGDEIIAFNGKEVVDILDYSYFDSMDEFTIRVKRGEKVIEIEVEKDEMDGMGLDFTDEGYLTPISCRNKCIFCFVDQLPKGMRKTLYVKDDDYRLSFVSGNYVTLTNVCEKEIQRIIDMKFSPIYISVHASDDVLRRKMLGNQNAQPIMPLLKRFAEAKIVMHTQVVLCSGINDKENLVKTVNDLYKLYPYVKSVAIVPVGLTNHREGLSTLQKIDKAGAMAAIAITQEFNSKIYAKRKENFAFCSDEMYITAEKEIPIAQYYGAFEQIENGVGLLSEFKSDFLRELKLCKGQKSESFVIITGESAYGFLTDLINKAKEKLPKLDVEIIAIKNQYFGISVTVAGLVTGGDIVKQLSNREIKGKILIPKVMLKEFDTVFLDGMTMSQLQEKIGKEIEIVDADGSSFAEAILNF